jgi:thiamine biosynthesis lipoprotein
MAWSPEPYIFEAIGTKWQIDLPDGLLASKKQELFKRIQERIAVFDRNYSRFRDDSLVTEISKKAGVYMFPDDAEPLFLLYEKLYQLTNGSVTPLIGNVLSDAGYDAVYSLQSKLLASPLDWDDVLERQGQQLTVKQPVILDFGAAGKGYLIDIVADMIRQEQIESFCVDAGGDMIYDNTVEPLRVGLEHPEDPKKIIGVAHILNQSLCGSAGNRRAWGKFHHIINPHTLESPKNIMAVWVIASSTLIADGLTTALFFTDPIILEKEYQFEYLIVYQDYSIQKSNQFPGEIF